MKEKIHFVSNLIAEYGLSALEKRLNAIHELLDDPHYIEVSVLGQFKAGKSSMLNSLTGLKILPTGALPLTSVITLISYGTQEKVKVISMDGPAMEINPNDIDKYITEKHNPNNEQGILQVEIETPALANTKELRFIDTPGLGSLYRSGTETTMSRMSETTVALIVISCIQVVSDSDISLIRETLSHSPFIFIVLSKTDLLNKMQLKEIKEFVRESLLKEFGREFSVIEYSIMMDESRHKNHLWEHYLIPFSKKGVEVRENLLEYKFESLIKNTIAYLQIAHAASQKDLSKREDLRNFILGERTQNHIIQKDLDMIGSLYKVKSRTIIEKNILDKHFGLISEKLESELKQKFVSWKGNIGKLTIRYENWLKESLSESLSEIIVKEDPVIVEHLARTRDHFNHYLKAFRESLNGKIKEIFNLSLPEQDWDAEVPSIAHPDIYIRPAFDIHVDMLGPIFPIFILRGWVKRYFLRQIKVEVEKNIYRIVNDLTALTHQAIKKLEDQAFEYIDTEITTIEKLLEDSGSASQDLEETLRSLEKLCRQ